MVAPTMRFLSELELALEAPHTRELLAFDALTPHVRESGTIARIGFGVQLTRHPELNPNDAIVIGDNSSNTANLARI